MRRLLLLAALLLPLVAAHALDNPVTNGSFEALDAEGKLVDWELLGKGETVATARTGQRALLLDRTADAPGETGLNRRWKINAGEQGAMLADLKGGLEFWYQAPTMGEDTRMVVGVIPMSDAPVEGTGSGRVMYTVPRSHVGDKQWHRGLLKYDFTDNDKVKWLHVAARITGGPGQLILDDIKWVPSVGPLPQVDQITLAETPGKAGEECTVKARIRNVGDQPMQAAQAVLALPPGLKATPGNTQMAPATAPDGIVYVQWTVTGPRDKPAALTVRLTSGEQVAENRLDLAPKLVVEQLRADRFLLAPEERTRLRLFVRNEGNVAVKGLTARLADTPAVADRAPQTLALLRPGETAAVEWMASLAKLSPSVPVTAEVLAGQEVVGQSATELICAPAMPVVRNQKPGAYAQAWDTGAVIGNDTLRLVLAVDAQKAVGPGWLQVSRNGPWQTVAVLPRLGSIATKPAGEGGGLREVGAAVAKASGDGKSATLVLDGKGIYEFSIAAGADTIEYSMSCVTDTKPLYGMHGPMLYVGEGTWGSRKTEAILPGLEWLTPDEESSSTLDIAANMPQRWRWCPPPHAVTIPCMS
ncbi:MAG: hypothetical protein KKI08_18030, partial [Armatimonadetes bacterium]|nr:hypothetical protein [Armatimonadota bacterium]